VWYKLPVLLLDAPLTLREFVTHEEVPLAAIFREVLQFLAERPDAVLFGAHAVNAYCEPERMTQEVDVLSTGAAALADELRARLSDALHIAARVREIIPGQGYRVYQIRKPNNRHLVDVRQTEALPSSQPFSGVQVIAPPELVAMKVVSMVHRAGRPKAGTDLVDVQRLLLAFPALKTEQGPVAERLRAMSAPELVIARWREIVAAPIEPDEDEGY
jgi:Nucleotidyl transferase AbiEii toxin, Type IV TA system